jgi:hypothetical protein
MVPTPPELTRLFTAEDATLALSKAFEVVRPRNYPVAEDPQFVPITDEKPFLAGNVRYVLSTTQVLQLFGLAGGVLGMVGVAVWRGLRSRGDPEIQGRSFRTVAGLALLIGANFLLMEHSLVLLLFRRFYVYDDALGMGAIGFLTVSGLGSLCASRRVRPWFLIASAVVMAVFLVNAGQLAIWRALIAMVPIALASGMFFPTLFDLASHKPVAVFALDAVGAGWGALLATFIPIVWGITAYFVVAGAVFLATLLADAWFHDGWGRIIPSSAVPPGQVPDRERTDLSA